MTSEQAIQSLQHAADYIFFTRVIQGSGKTMRGTAEAWQAMSTLHGLRNVIQAEPGARAQRDGFRKTDIGEQRGSVLEMAPFAVGRPKLAHRAALVQIPMLARSAS